MTEKNSILGKKSTLSLKIKLSHKYLKLKYLKTTFVPLLNKIMYTYLVINFFPLVMQHV